MRFLNWFFVGYWATYAILTWCGVYEPSNFTVGCGFICAALGFLGYALDYYRR